jgi:ankyrin repeat protein
MMRFLLKRSPEALQYRSVRGRTVLQFAASCGMSDMVTQLLAHGVAVDEVDLAGQRALPCQSILRSR